MKLKILLSDVRGLSDVGKSGSIRRLLSRWVCDVATFQETKIGVILSNTDQFPLGWSFFLLDIYSFFRSNGRSIRCLAQENS